MHSFVQGPCHTLHSISRDHGWNINARQGKYSHSCWYCLSQLSSWLMGCTKTMGIKDTSREPCNRLIPKMEPETWLFPVPQPGALCSMAICSWVALQQQTTSIRWLPRTLRAHEQQDSYTERQCSLMQKLRFPLGPRKFSLAIFYSICRSQRDSASSIKARGTVLLKTIHDISSGKF